MEKEINFIIVEDNVSDALLIERELKKNWQECTITKINHKNKLSEVMKRGDIDVVVCDYMFSDFTGLDVLNMFRECCPKVLVYIVSGVIKEKDSSEIIEAGAKDFILKENLSRLISAIKRDLKELDKLRKHEESEKELKEKQEELQKFNSYMVNREMRIIELKKEVNALAKELGKKLPYREET